MASTPENNDEGSNKPVEVAVAEPVLDDSQGTTITPVAAISNPAPEDRANPISRIFFSFATGLFLDAFKRRRAVKKNDIKRIMDEAAGLPEDERAKLQRKLHGELEEEDFWALPDDDHVAPLAAKFEKAFNEYKKKPGDSETKRLTVAIYAVSKRPMIIAGFIKVVNTGLQFSYPFILNQLLFTLQPASKRPLTDAYLWALGLGAAMMIKALTENSYFWYAARGGWRARQALSSAIYRKALRLSLASRQSKTLGEMVNLMQLDASKVELFFSQAHSIWDGVLQIVGYTLILFWVINWAAFVGFAFMLVMIPQQGMIMKKLMGIERKAVKVTDERVKKVNEAIQGILGVKMSAWEESFSKVLGGVRDQEVGLLHSTVWLRAFSSAYMMSTPALTAAIAIAVYVTVINGTINAATLFTALNLLGQLRFPLMLYPLALAQYVQASVSRKRLAAFLDMDEVNFESQILDAAQTDSVVELKDVTVYWADPAKPQPVVVSPKAGKKGRKAKSNSKGSLMTAETPASTSIVPPATGPTASMPMMPAAPATSLSSLPAPSGMPGAPSTVPAVSASSMPGLPSQASQTIGTTAAAAVADAGSQASITAQKSLTDAQLGTTAQKSLTPALENVNLTIKRGELVAIVGGVGQGKTALVNTILREMFLTAGSVSLKPGPVSFASQTPWILNASIKDNIVFGAEFDPEWYERVLDAAQLRHDLSLFEHYDMTEIGERGVSLSGGQKQRVSIARAAYHSRSSVMVVLDDPISALDPEVAGRLFEECVLDLLEGQTRIVVTNSLDVLKECDRIVMITGGEGIPGRIAEQGTFEALMATENSLFAALMTRHRGHEKEESRTPSPADGEEADDDAARGQQKKLSRKGKMSSNVLIGRPDKDKKLEKQGTSIIRAEERAKGSVKGNVYGDYIRAGGGFFVFFLVYLIFILSQGFAWLNTYWMTLWSNDVNPNGTYKTKNATFFLVGYALTAILMALSAFVRTGALMSMALRASTNLHNQLLRSVLHASMFWFDTTPTGRILQRFSQDVRTLDFETSDNASFFLFTTLFVLTSIGTIIGVTPIFAAFILPFALLYYVALMFYRPVMRDAKRIGSIVTSPVYAHFSETLGGVVSVRAFRASKQFAENNAAALNRMTKMNMALKLCERWLGVRLEILGTSVCFISALFCVQGVQAGFLTAGLAGLSLSFSMSTTFMLTSTIRSFTALEAGMNSVERVRYMGTQIPQEKWRKHDYAEGSLVDVPADWPQQGEIVVKDLTMKYREETPLVLKGISFHIRGGEKIGVAGRTGSGKSSLFLTLMRIVEPQPGSQVIIDGIDVAHITLFELRSKIAIAPQLPVLFSGTLRYNVDPFETHTDAEIWDALEKVGLKASIQSLPQGLLAPVSEYGENFSQGERQLISLSRAVLAKPKILLLDESTASLDADRDQLIQRTIHESFRTATLIVIAHRLETIVRSDRILVLGDGHVMEFDAPAKLLENPESQLSLAVAEMGAGQAERMKKQASSKF